MSSESITREVLVEGLDDWVPIDRVIGMAREEAEITGGDFKEVAVSVVDSLLSRDEAKIGVIGDAGFEAWEGTVPEIITRLAEELDSVDWQPYGGGCWICNTPIGDRAATQSADG